MDEELVQQQLWLGTDVVLGSAVAAVNNAHTGLTGKSPLGDVWADNPSSDGAFLTRNVGKCNWLYTSNVFQVSKHGFWSHCSKEE